MKKLIIFLCLILVVGVANARPTIGENLSGGKTSSGYEFIQLDVKNQAVVTSSYITWEASDIAGFSSIDFYGVSVSSGNATTLSAVPVMNDGTVLTGEAQIITQGTDLTDLKSGYYKFYYYNNVAIPTTVTFNFLIAD